MDFNNDTNAYLRAILQELQASKQQLGFGHSPKPRYIYANRQYPDSLWYFWDGAKKEHEPILFQALTGIVEKLEIDQKEYKGKPEFKANLHIKADRNYVIQSGLETLFAKGLVYTFSKLPVTSSEKLFTPHLEPGNTKNSKDLCDVEIHIHQSCLEFS
jgi:3',5'-cyclic AMP phosphodiesterase CpdA